MKDHDPLRNLRISYGEVRYVPASETPQAPPAAAAEEPRRSRVKRLDEGLDVARSTVLNVLIILVVAIGVAFTVIELRRDVVVIDAIRLPQALQDMGYSEQVAAIRLWANVARISDAARTDKDRVALLPASQQVDFEAPGAGVSVQSLMQALRAFLGLDETRIAGEFLCGTPACDPEGLALRLRVFRRDRMEIISLDPIGEETGMATAGASGDAAGEPLTETNIKHYFHRAALALLRKLDPFIVASYLFQDGQPEAARAEALKLTGPKRPERKWALNLLGLIAADGGDNEAAVTWFKQAVEADPEDSFAIAYLNWGNVLRSMGEPEAAIAKYRRATELDRGDALAFNNWGAALSDMGQPDAAIEKYRHATELEPDEALAYNNWGSALFEKGEAGAAIGLYKRATEIDPDYAVAFVNWGNALFIQEDLAGAVEQYRRALELDPQLSSANFNMALALRQLGRVDEAIAAFEGVLEIGTDADTAQWVRAQIGALQGLMGGGPAARDGAAQDSTAQDGAARDGTAQDGMAQDGAAANAEAAPD